MYRNAYARKLNKKLLKMSVYAYALAGIYFFGKILAISISCGKAHMHLYFYVWAVLFFVVNAPPPIFK
jgi:hypothetical protein